MDVSKKYGMEYRLLHAITKGHPWYGNWGYEFGSGSFALTQDAYREAVETLSHMPLSFFIFQGRKPRTHIQDLILFYQSLSECELVNTRDLFHFVMSLVHDVQKPSLVSEHTFKKRRSCAPGVLCAWTKNDIKRVEGAMVRVLRAVTGSNWVSWRTLRGAVCKAGPPELLDYCLKEFGGKQTPEGMTVHARCNPNTGALEYRSVFTFVLYMLVLYIIYVSFFKFLQISESSFEILVQGGVWKLFSARKFGVCIFIFELPIQRTNPTGHEISV